MLSFRRPHADARPVMVRDQRGFTMIEVVVAMAILLVGLLGTAALLNGATFASASSQAREQGTNLSRELVEAARSIPYDQLTPASVAVQVQAKSALGDDLPSTAGWQIRRRGITYTVAVGACAVDDPQDGTGAHDAGTFCASGVGATTPAQCAAALGTDGSIQGVAGASSLAVGDCGIDLNLDGTVDDLTEAAVPCAPGSCPAPSTADAAPDDYKRIVVLVRWARGSGARYVLQSATVPNPGSAAGPAVTAIDPPSDTVLDGTSVTFTATTSRTPNTVGWLVDGNAKAGGTGSGTTWSWTWSLGSIGTSQPAEGEVLDGSYLVSAKAFDAYGVYGPARAATVTIDRRRPYAPVRAYGGRNGSVVEIEWAANQEHDTVGYRVYRHPASGADVPICSTTSQLACQDTSPPDADTLTYYVVALDKDLSLVGQPEREGDHSAPITVTRAFDPPGPPTALTATTVDATSTLVTWTAPATGSVAFYRIYRDGTSYADRYDSTAGTETTYTDKDTNGAPHTYYVTAVNDQLAESSRTPGVSGG
jgi:prepilin-type N-terminal cleavage/methylation domain-containing protein